MQTQQNSRSGYQVGGFSSALNHATASRSSATRTSASTASRPGFDAYEPYNNRNISSIVSRISDEGPARLKQPSRNVVQEDRPDVNLEAWQLSEDRYTPANDQRSLPQSTVGEQRSQSPESAASNRSKIPLPHQLVLLVVVVLTVVAAVFLYRIDRQTDQLRAARDVSAQQFQGAAAEQTERAELLPQLTHLDQAVSALSAELQNIKRVQQQIDRRLNQERAENGEPQLAQMAATSEQVKTLKQQFEHMQHEVREMESALEVMKTGTSSETRVLAPLPRIMPVPEQKTGQFMVNLASLASEKKARAAYDRLVDAGVLPMIEQTMVDGRRTYRITVNGFSSRESAQAFVQKASKKHGFEGGWIRPN